MTTLTYVLKGAVAFLFTCCCLSLTAAESSPFFTTDIVLNEKGEMFLSQKGLKRIDLFTADGTKRKISFPLDETPTGLLADNSKLYVTTFEKTGKLQIVDMESGSVEAAVPTGSGACSPLFSPDKSSIYVLNQFSIQYPR